MKHLPLLLFALILVQPVCWGATPAEAATLALRDVKKLPPDVQQNSVFFWQPENEAEQLQRFFRVFAFHINSISREADLQVPARVVPDLWRVDIRDYGWNKGLFKKLAQVDPYFHTKLQAVNVLAVPVVPAAIKAGDTVQTVRECSGFDENNPSRVRGIIDAGTSIKVLQVQEDLLLWGSPRGNVWVSKNDVRKAAAQQIDASAPWLPAKEMAELISLTQNEAPLLRADWFFAQTARAIGRNGKADGANYYDFLGLKNQKDAEDLAGLDRNKAKKIQREIAAIVAESGVALNNRQVFRFGTIAGAWWETRDVEESTGRKNAVRQLDDDFGPPDALEVYATLPNRLFLLLAVNGKGELQATVPDKIASDSKTTSKDYRIHNSLSCVRCHVEGLRPIDDWGRSFFSNPPGDAKLVSPDYERLKRLRRLYLAPLEDDLNADVAVYAKTLQRLTGWTPKEAAKAYAAAWQMYADLPVTGQQLALELGVSHEDMLTAFKAYANVATDPILISYLKNPEMVVRREYIEEAYPLFQEALRFKAKE